MVDRNNFSQGKKESCKATFLPFSELFVHVAETKYPLEKILDKRGTFLATS